MVVGTTVLTAGDVRRLDANADFLGVPTRSLMAAAGAQVALRARAMLDGDGRRVVVLAGTGNNGGDGLVAAQRLAADHEVTVLVAGGPGAIKTAEARAALEDLDEARVRVEAFEKTARAKELLADAHLVIDAMLGVGATGALREPVRTMARLANAAGAPILAVDVPTGFGGRGAVEPQQTVTLHAKKKGMTKANSGRIHVADIGIPEAAETRCGPGDIVSWWRPNAPQSRKGDNGRLLIIGGGPYGGAPMLSSLAALRTGVDLVRLATPRRVAPVAQAAMPDLIVHWTSQDDEVAAQDVAGIEPLIRKSDAVLIGPGLGTGKDAQQAVAQLLKVTGKHKRAVILDADAIGTAGAHAQTLKGREVLMTPHAGEFRALTGQRLPKDGDKAWQAAHEAARRFGATLLLKGAIDRITDGKRRRENHVHHSVMTRGGTGDVLAGVAAAFMARGADAFDAACSAAFLVGATGARLVQTSGHGTLASDVAAALPQELLRWTPG